MLLKWGRKQNPVLKMCCIFKISHSNRINRRKRKIFALLSLTSGLTMLVMVQIHHVSIIHRVGTDLIPLAPPTTNDTPVDYFLPGDVEGGTEVPYPAKRLNIKDLTQIAWNNLPGNGDHLNNNHLRKRGNPFKRAQFVPRRRNIQESNLAKSDVTVEALDISADREETNPEITTEGNLLCCDDDFHQNPYPSDESLNGLRQFSDKFYQTKNREKYHMDNSAQINSPVILNDGNVQNNVNYSKKFTSKAVSKSVDLSVALNDIRMQDSAHKANYRIPINPAYQTAYENVEAKNYAKIQSLNNVKYSKDTRHNTKRLNEYKNYQSEKYRKYKTLKIPGEKINSNTTLRNPSKNNNIGIQINSEFEITAQDSFKKMESNSSLKLQKPFLNNKGDKILGNTIININIENFVNNSPMKYLSALRNKTYAKELIQDIEKLSKKFKEKSSVRTKLSEIVKNTSFNEASNNTNSNASNSEIVIPEVTVSNTSYSMLKEKSLKHILNKFDLTKIFHNSSYRNTILSRDLSQWSEFLSLPEEDPGNTYEPNNIIDSSYYEKKLKKNTNKQDNSNKGTNKEKLFVQSYHRLENIKVPNSLKEIQRHRIRESFVAPQATLTYFNEGFKRPRRPSNHEYVNDQTAHRQNQEENELPGDGEDEGEDAPHDVLFPYYLDYTRPAYFPWRSTKDECTLYATRFLVGRTGKIVPLASFPGSGNTWLRYISEVLTGIFTGALYEDDILAVEGFWGERDSYVEGTTLLQKTHSFPALPEEVLEWDGRIILGPSPRKVILLMRSPYEALVSLRHFHAAGHTGFGRHSAFSGLGWDNFTEVRAISWLQLNKAWLELPKTQVLVIHYEMIMQNLEGESKRLLNFLGIPIDYGRLSCLLRYPEGKFRRPRYPKHLQGYKISQKSAYSIASAITLLNQILAKNGHPVLPTHLYSFHPPTWSSPTRDGEVATSTVGAT